MRMRVAGVVEYVNSCLNTHGVEGDMIWRGGARTGFDLFILTGYI